MTNLAENQSDMIFNTLRNLALIPIFLFAFTACEKQELEPEDGGETTENPIDSATVLPAKVLNSSIIGIRKDIASCEFLLELGNSKIERAGVCWDKESNGEPSAYGSFTDAELQSNMKTYTVKITGLSTETDYTARAFVVQNGKAIYGDKMLFKSGKYYTEGGGATDRSGNFYKTIIIGDQEWFASDLKTTKYNDGSSIKEETRIAEWGWVSTPTPFRYRVTGGMLYNHYTLQSNKKLCPNGWRLPSDKDWNKLIEFIDDDFNQASLVQSKLGNQINKNYNFNINYPGYVSPFGGGKFEYKDKIASYWSTTASKDYADQYMAHRFYSDRNAIERVALYEKNGICIRCIKE